MPSAGERHGQRPPGHCSVMKAAPESGARTASKPNDGQASRPKRTSIPRACSGDVAGRPARICSAPSPPRIEIADIAHGLARWRAERETGARVLLGGADIRCWSKRGCARQARGRRAVRVAALPARRAGRRSRRQISPFKAVARGWRLQGRWKSGCLPTIPCPVRPAAHELSSTCQAQIKKADGPKPKARPISRPPPLRPSPRTEAKRPVRAATGPPGGGLKSDYLTPCERRQAPRSAFLARSRH